MVSHLVIWGLCDTNTTPFMIFSVTYYLELRIAMRNNRLKVKNFGKLTHQFREIYRTYL